VADDCASASSFAAALSPRSAAATWASSADTFVASAVAA